MSTQYKQYEAREGEFGSSSGFMAKIENGKVSEILSTSTGETNYEWDFYPNEKELVGLSGKELSDKMAHYYDDFNDEYRHPWIQEKDISKETYEEGKAELAEKHAEIARLSEIEERRNKVLAQKAKLNEKIGNRPDKLEQKAHRLHSAKTPERRISLAKKFMKKSRGE